MFKIQEIFTLLLIESIRGGLNLIALNMKSQYSHGTSLKLNHFEVLGVGVAGLDYLLRVPSYPKLDAKIRTTDYKICGGGNVANTLTSLSRLGIRSALFSIFGKDSTGDIIISELHHDGIDTSTSLRTDLSLSAITHIIVDDETNSRTCLHTAMTQELTSNNSKEMWSKLQSEQQLPNFIHFDSRQTIAAIAVAHLANDCGIPTSIDVEKFRPCLDDLIPQIDIIFTNQHFPALYSEKIGIDGLNGINAMTSLLLHPNRARVIVTTMGSQGSLMICKSNDSLDDLRPRQRDIDFKDPEYELLTEQLLPLLHLSPLSSHMSTEAITLTDRSGHSYEFPVRVIRCSAWTLDPGDIVDTTGAGDAFIGGFIFGFLRGFDEELCMKMGTIVAAEKLRGFGARSSLPTIQTLIHRLKFPI